jgi:hypothetical protein
MVRKTHPTFSFLKAAMFSSGFSSGRDQAATDLFTAEKSEKKIEELANRDL